MVLRGMQLAKLSSNGPMRRRHRGRSPVYLCQLARSCVEDLVEVDKSWDFQRPLADFHHDQLEERSGYDHYLLRYVILYIFHSGCADHENLLGVGFYLYTICSTYVLELRAKQIITMSIFPRRV